MKVLERGGTVIGPPHSGGGVPFVLQDTGTHIEEEGREINIPRELAESDQIFNFYGSNAYVLNKILNLAGLSITDKVTTVKSGDIVICVRSAWDDNPRKFVGTIEEILYQINTSGGCKPIIKSQVPSHKSQVTRNSQFTKKSMKERLNDAQIENPNSLRWLKKKARLEELSNHIHHLRMVVSRDLTNEDERTALTALVVAVMDRTAERIGNDDSADNGHFGVTGFQKKHISVVGSKVHLDYVGKSGTKHEKSFSDERIAKALKKAIKNAPGKFIFETSDGFRIKSDKVNRYLEPFKISAKDIRGYLANKWIIEKLKLESSKVEKLKSELQLSNLTTLQLSTKLQKERKKIFNKVLKQVAGDVGHGKGTLRKHYMIPELPIEYIENGRIIDMKNLGYFKEGGPLKKGIEVEKEHKNLFEKIKKQLAAKGIAMPVTEQEFYTDIAKVHIKERKDYYDLLEKYVEKYSNENFMQTDPIINRLLAENSQEILALDFDDSEMLWDEETNRRFYVKRISQDKFIIEESGSLDKKYPQILILHSQLMSEGSKLTNENLKPMKNKKDMFAGKSIGEMIQQYISNWKSYMPRYIIEFHDGYQTVTDHDRAMLIAKKEGDATIIDVKTMKSENFYKGEKLQEGGPTEEPIMQEEPAQTGCICFWDYLEAENPELLERCTSEEIESNPELHEQLDEEIVAWKGGKINDDRIIVNGYIIRYNPLFKSWHVSHPEIGAVGDFKNKEDAIEHVKNE